MTKPLRANATLDPSVLHYALWRRSNPETHAIQFSASGLADDLRISKGQMSRVLARMVTDGRLIESPHEMKGRGRTATIYVVNDPADFNDEEAP